MVHPHGSQRKIKNLRVSPKATLPGLTSRSGWIPPQIEQGTFFQCNSKVSPWQPCLNVCTLCTVRQLWSKRSPNGFMLGVYLALGVIFSLFKPTHPACLRDWQLLDELIQKLTGTEIRQRPTFVPHIGHWRTLSCYKRCFFRLNFGMRARVRQDRKL